MEKYNWEKINWKELFDNKNNTFHCETEEIANEFLKIVHEHGYEWSSGQSYLLYNYWNRFRENTCYWIGDSTYDSLEYFQTQTDCVIINVNDNLNGVRRPFKLNRK